RREARRIAARRLRALRRDNEPQRRLVELGVRAGVADASGILLDGTPELGCLSERPAACFLAGHGRRVERADLDADAARLEPRQPVALERSLLAGPQDELEAPLGPAVHDELEQHVVV